MGACVGASVPPHLRGVLSVTTATTASGLKAPLPLTLSLALALGADQGHHSSAILTAADVRTKRTHDLGRGDAF